MIHYDVIVLGTGGVGSAAAFHLARRGARVLGLDRFAAGHDRGSSHGQTRIIRQAYFEHPDYVPLLKRAYPLWAELEELSGEKLYHEVGLIEIGPPDGIVVRGVLESARKHGLDVESIRPTDASERFPGFAIPDGYAAVYERRAGYLLVERCVMAHLAAALRHGASLKTNLSVKEWRIDGTDVIVETSDGQSFRAGRLVITTGAWAQDFLAGLGIELRVLRKHLHWYASDQGPYRPIDGCPAFFYELPEGMYYGFPAVDARGVKVGEHNGGSAVTDPLHVDRGVEPDERARVESFLAGHMPRVSRHATDHTVCLYTMSADEHFIVDRHPQHQQVVFAAGLSGHGFKFTGVLGQALADLTLEGKTTLPIDFLRVSRPSICQTPLA